MPLIKLLKSSSKLFKKDVITFLIVRRHDLGVPKKSLCYISVRPNASLTALRQKVWHLLELPDYCEEHIILKTDRNVEVPLTELKKGNTPQTSLILEVWPPEKRMHNSQIHNMLTMGQGDPSAVDCVASISRCDCNVPCGHNAMDRMDSNVCSQTTVSMSPVTLKYNNSTRTMHNMTDFDFKKPERNLASVRKSSTSLFHRLHGKKSIDNFSNVLLKIQTDLNSLTQKLSTLENRVISEQKEPTLGTL